MNLFLEKMMTLLLGLLCVSDVKCVEKLHQDEHTLDTSTRQLLEGNVSDGRLTRLTVKRRVIRTISLPTGVASRRKTTVEILTQIGGMKQSGAIQRIQVCSGNLVTSQSVVSLPLSCVFVICWTVWIVVKVQQAWFIDVWTGYLINIEPIVSSVRTSYLYCKWNWYGSAFESNIIGTHVKTACLLILVFQNVSVLVFVLKYHRSTPCVTHATTSGEILHGSGRHLEFRLKSQIFGINYRNFACRSICQFPTLTSLEICRF